MSQQLTRLHDIRKRIEAGASVEDVGEEKRTAQASGFWHSYDMLCLSSSQEID